MKQRPSGWVIGAFILPAFALYSIFLIYPLVQALFFSLFEWKGTNRGGFIGLDNFRALFTRIPFKDQLPNAFGHNLTFFVGTMLIQNTLGLVFAVTLHNRRRGQQFFRTVYLTPYMLSPLVVGYLWSLILNPTFGPVNRVLKTVGLESLALPWLGDPDTALPVVILVNAWQWIGFPMMLFGAALGAIPDDYLEAARLDGANAWQRLRWIIVPLLTPVIGTITILTFIGNFNIFGLVWALGGVEGGPAGETDVLSLLFYRTAFRGGVDAFGVASALAVVMFGVVFGVSIFVRFVFGRLEARVR